MTGWPWPLDAVQNFFEGLWNWVSEAVNAAGRWVYTNVVNALNWVKERIVEAFTVIGNNFLNALNVAFKSLSAGINWLGGQLSKGLTWLGEKITGGITWLGQKVWDGLVWVKDRIGEGLGFVVKNVSDGVNTVINTVSNGVGWLAGTIGGAISEAVGTIGKWVSDALSGVVSALGQALASFGNWVLSNLMNIGSTIGKFLTKDAIPALWNLIKGVGEFFGGLFTKGFSEIWKLITGVKIGGAPAKGMTVQTLTFGGAELKGFDAGGMLDSALNVLKTLVMTLIPIGLAFVAGELVHPLKELGLGHLSAILFDVAGYKQIVSDIMASITYVTTVLPLRSALMAVAQPLLPREEEVLQFIERGVLNHNEFITVMNRLGFQDYWAELFWASHWKMPYFEYLQPMFWRGLIDEKKFREALKYNAYPDEFIKAFEGLIWRIPPISDLIEFVVHEVITPEKFYELSKKQGFSRQFAEWYWENHWKLPSFSNVREAFWRGIITEEEFRKYIMWHDYKPEPRAGISKSDRDIMNELSYNLPDKIDARWMLETGEITAEELRDLYARQGLHPDWQDKVASAVIKEIFRSEVETIVREAMYDYRDGWLTRKKYLQILDELGLPDPLKQYWIKRGDMLAAREAKKELEKIYVESFRLGYITEDELRSYLLDLGKDPNYVERLIYQETLRKIGRGG